MQEPLSGFITVCSRLVEGSGSHMAWSEAIIEGLKGLMLSRSLTLSLQYSIRLCAVRAHTAQFVQTFLITVV